MSSIVSDFILLIFNCKKYMYKALKQKETWLKNFTLMPYFHIIGDPTLESEYLFDLQENILYVRVLDDYNSLPKKVIAAYAAINKEYTFKYIFKTDDDQNLNSLRFLNTIKDLITNKVPHIPELPKHLPVLQTKYCSGRFYLLSALAVQQLISKRKLIEEEYLEDYAIGFNLDNALKTNMFHIQTNKYFTDFM